MKIPDGQQLILALKAGKKEGVAQWYAFYQPKLSKFFVGKVSNQEDCDELVHDTFLSCLASLPLFRETSGLYSWMLGIARHELADYYRKKYAKKVIATLPFGEEILLSVSEPTKEKDTIATQVLRRLPEDISELLLLKYVDKQSVKILAAKFGLEVSAMQSRIYRAKLAFISVYEELTEGKV